MMLKVNDVDVSCMDDDDSQNRVTQIGDEAFSVSTDVPPIPEKMQKKVYTKKSNANMRRRKSGYIVYAAEIRKYALRESPHSTFGEISRIVGQKWRNLSKEDKMKYEQKSRRMEEEKKVATQHEKEYAFNESINYWDRGQTSMGSSKQCSPSGAHMAPPAAPPHPPSSTVVTNTTQSRLHSYISNKIREYSINHQELLSDPSHVNNLSLSLYQLQQQGIMCDCSIRARQGSLDVHRLVLMASDSPYLQEKLRMIPSTYGQYSGQPGSICIFLKDQDLVVVQTVVQFVYMGTMSISMSNADRVLSLCKRLGLTKAVKLCEDFVQKYIDTHEHLGMDEFDTLVNLLYSNTVTSTVQHAHPVTSIDHSGQDEVPSNTVEGQNVPALQIPTNTSAEKGGRSTFFSSPDSDMLGTMYIYRSRDHTDVAAGSGTDIDEVEKIDIRINHLSDDDVDDADGGYDVADEEDDAVSTVTGAMGSPVKTIDCDKRNDEEEKRDIGINSSVCVRVGNRGYDREDEEDSKSTPALLDSISKVTSSLASLDSTRLCDEYDDIDDRDFDVEHEQDSKNTPARLYSMSTVNGTLASPDKLGTARYIREDAANDQNTNMDKVQTFGKKRKNVAQSESSTVQASYKGW